MSEIAAQSSMFICASPGAIWNALTTPAKLKRFFFAAEVESDWKVGSPIRMKGEFQGKPYEDKGKIIAFEPAKRLSFSHWSALSGTQDKPENYHVVTFDLVPHDGTTKVTITQTNLTGGVRPSDIEHRAQYEKNWNAVLDGLSKVFQPAERSIPAARSSR
jgi:uncharacterized protein YndB with AHSA1/START domain